MGQKSSRNGIISTSEYNDHSKCKCQTDPSYQCELPKMIKDLSQTNNIHLIINRQREGVKDTDKSTYVATYRRSRNNLEIFHFTNCNPLLFFKPNMEKRWKEFDAEKEVCVIFLTETDILFKIYIKSKVSGINCWV